MTRTRRNRQAHMLSVSQGNKPPWTLSVKAAYSTPDAARAKRYFGIPNMQTPSFFPILSLLPQRVLVRVKAAHSDLYVQVFLDIFTAMWEEGQDVSKADVLSRVLSNRFQDKQVQDILHKATTPECKQALNANTKEALERGAFGCPWFWVRNASGDEEPFFGSDRYVRFLLVGIYCDSGMVSVDGSFRMSF